MRIRAQAIIMNLNVLSKVDYRERVKVWEDLDFNLRISGLKRLAGGGTEKLTGKDATRFRAVAARLNYLSQDRADLAVATMRHA